MENSSCVAGFGHRTVRHEGAKFHKRPFRRSWFGIVMSVKSGQCHQAPLLPPQWEKGSGDEGPHADVRCGPGHVYAAGQPVDEAQGERFGDGLCFSDAPGHPTPFVLTLSVSKGRRMDGAALDC